MASAMVSTAQQMGGSIGTAVFSSLAATQSRTISMPDVETTWTPTGFVDTIRSGTMVYEERPEVGQARKNYTQEYKDEAVELVISSGRPIAEIARNWVLTRERWRTG